MSDNNAILADTGEVTLADGTVILLEELQLRQFLRLLRIITDGTPANVLVDGIATLGADDGNFGANLMLLVTMGLPNAEDAVINFLLSMVRPKGMVGGPGGKARSRMTKQEIERDEAKLDELANLLENPSLEDTVILLEAIFKSAAKDFEALGKRMTQMFEVAKKTGMLGGLSTPSQA